MYISNTRKRWACIAMTLTLLSGVFATGQAAYAASNNRVFTTAATEASMADARASLHTVATPTTDGEYTLTYKVTKEGSSEDSMVGGMFDARAKLVVGDGKLTVSMLCTAEGVMGDSLIDFTLGKGGSYAASSESAVTVGSKSYRQFSMEVPTLSEKLSLAALVSAMNGNINDKGNYGTYTKADIEFTAIDAGWYAYQVEIDNRGKSTGDQALIDALCDQGYDTDGDGDISDAEWAAIKGRYDDYYEAYVLDLGHYGLTDISLLSKLTNAIECILLTGNDITELPAGLCANMKSLKYFLAAGNQIASIDPTAFVGANSLEWIELSNNKLTTVGSEFSNLPGLKDLEINDNELVSIDKDALVGSTAVSGVFLRNNNLVALPDGLFAPCAGTLSYLDISGNKFEKLPSALNGCRKLNTFYGYNNCMTSVGDVDFSTLAGLETFSVYHNDIESLPEGLFAANANLRYIDFYDNNIGDVNASMLPKLSGGSLVPKYDLSANNMAVVDPTFLMKINGTNRPYPQKTPAALTAAAQGSTALSWSQQLGIIDIHVWWSYNFDDLHVYLQSLDQYLAMLADTYDGKDAATIMKDGGYVWDIVTEIQKKQAGGTFKTVRSTTDTGNDDVLSGSQSGLEPGTYRIRKVFNAARGTGEKTRLLAMISNEVELKAEPIRPPAPTKTDISKATVTGVVDKWYAVDKSGKAAAQTQKPVVKLNGKTLKEGTDYKLTYANNKARTAGDKRYGPTNKATSATVTITGIGSYTGKVSKSFQIKGVEVYRLYNPKSGEHLYTTDTNERKVLTSSYGWKYEGVAWYAVGKPARPGQPAQGNTTPKPVYRVYQPKTGEHHYTTDANEVKVLSSSHGWRNEGVFAYTNTDTAKDVAVQMNRLYNPKVRPVASHHHTADTNEVKVLTSSHGWRTEGISWHGC